MESTSPATDLEWEILENSEKCYEFFMGKFELDQDNFKYQMTQLAKMSYMTLLHLEEELKQDARNLDAKNINKPDVPILPMEKVESADTVFTEEDQPESESVIESADPAGAGEDLITPLSDTESLETDVMSITLSGDYSSSTHSHSPGTPITAMRRAPDTEGVKTGDSFISTLLNTIKKVAPNLRFKPKHLRRKKFKVVP